MARLCSHRFSCFGFTHVLDGGWTGEHYCRSLELLGMHKFGVIVGVDKVEAPYGHTRRLVTACDVGRDAKLARSAVQDVRYEGCGPIGTFHLRRVLQLPEVGVCANSSSERDGSGFKLIEWPVCLRSLAGRVFRTL